MSLRVTQAPKEPIAEKILSHVGVGLVPTQTGRPQGAPLQVVSLGTEVCLGFAAADLQFELYFLYQPELTVAALLSLVDLSSRWPTHPWVDYAVGIWGKVVEKTVVLQPGDRVELYQPLRIDPKTARQMRVRKGSGPRKGEKPFAL